MKTKRIISIILIDIVSIMLSAYASLLIRFDFGVIPSIYLKALMELLPYKIIITLIIFFLFKLYSSLWKYAGVKEVFNIFLACITCGLSTNAITYILNISLPRSFYAFDFILLLFFVGLSRICYRVVRYMKNNHKKDGINTMIIGAGEAGSSLIKEFANNIYAKEKVVCVIDKNEKKLHKYINGIKVVGKPSSIPLFAEIYKVEEIIIAIPSIDKIELNELISICTSTGCKVKKLPKITDLDKNKLINNIASIEIEDLLGRDEVVVKEREILDFIKDKTILITGGGGSIGSELARQIVKKKPKKLVILDIYENNLYDLQMELERLYPSIDLETVIASVREEKRLDTIFKKYKFDLVFHAAAHKHVPLMEYSPNEAIKNNCLGTLNTAKMCDKYHVKKMVLISTDKAVRPTNVMGASKRICEMIIQSYNNKSKTDYVAVRFGNVLGSNGSVIPLFKKQIECGGPVTVTDKEITRFFMTIKEAVMLVLQASFYASGGEIFVLDMGSPVKIYDLAVNLIKLEGLVPNKDIEIKITGLRPGEKLYEEILMDEEGLKSTPNKLIHIGKPIEFDEKEFYKKLDNIIKESFNETKDIRKLLKSIVDTYEIKE